MRSRAFLLQGLLVTAALVFAASAAATPTATLVVTPLPISGFPGTGDILGAGTAVEVQVRISGSEYGGYPSPLTEAVFYAPAGVKVQSAGFPTCAPIVLEADGPGSCPKESRAGPIGEGLG